MSSTAVMDSIAENNFPIFSDMTMHSFNTTTNKLGDIPRESILSLVDILNIYLIPVIIVVGLAGNSAAFIVLMVTPRLFCQSSNMYLAFLAMVDNLSLVFVMTVWFGWIGINFFHRNGWCQAINYFASVCSFLSAWTVIGFTCERWVTIFHPLKRHIICTKRKAIIIMTSLTIGSMTFYSFTLFIYKVKTFPNGREVCLMVYKFLVLSKIAFFFDTLLNVVMPLIIIITMNFGMALKIWLYTRRNSKTQCLMKLQPSSVKNKEIICASFVSKSRLNPMSNDLSNCQHFEGSRGSSKEHSHRCQHSNRRRERTDLREGKRHPSSKDNDFQNLSKVTTRNERMVSIKPNCGDCRSVRSEKSMLNLERQSRSPDDEMPVDSLRRHHLRTSLAEFLTMKEFAQKTSRQTSPQKLDSIQLASNNSTNAGVNSQQNPDGRSGGNATWQVLTKKRQTQVRITRALLSISTFFILFNLPSYVFRIYSFFNSAKKHQNIASLIVQFLHFSNFSSRFFLYSACSRNFRYAINRFACQRHQRHRNKRRV